MRALLAAILAVPVILSTYLPRSLRVSTTARLQPIALGAILLYGIGAFAAVGAWAPANEGAQAPMCSGPPPSRR